MLRILQGPSPALYISQADMDTQKQMSGENKSVCLFPCQVDFFSFARPENV